MVALFVPIFHCYHNILMTVNVIKLSFRVGKTKLVCIITRLSLVTDVGYRYILGDLRLTHLGRMDFPILIIWISPFSFLGTSGVFFSFLLHFSMKIKIANRIAPDGGYSVCLCPIKGTPELFG